MNFLDPLIQLFKDFGVTVLPFYVVPQYESGLILRLGVYRKDAKPGFNWKLFFFDEVITCRNTTTTMNVEPQTLTTKDGKNVIVSSIVKYRIVDPKIFLLEVEDAFDAIADICQGETKRLIVDRTWDECTTNDLDNEIQKKTKSSAKRWGIDVDLVTITELAIVRSYRLLQ
jgi:regulator of protease activity HflC (stomatin/prohibitin superfamily)